MTPLAELLADIADADARWFRDNPGAIRRVRVFVENKFGLTLIPVGGAAPIRFVEVVQLAPGVRARIPIVAASEATQ